MYLYFYTFYFGSTFFNTLANCSFYTFIENLPLKPQIETQIKQTKSKSTSEMDKQKTSEEK